MKPRSILLLVLTCLFAVVLQVGVGFWLIRSHPGALQQNPDCIVEAPQDIRFDMPVMPDLFAPEEEPIAPQEIDHLRAETVVAKDFVLSAPVTQGNLTVFFIEGKETLMGRQMMSLENALAQGRATVHEGITVENHGNVPLFIQAGDIIKGGSQDRTLPYDMIIPVASQRVPLPAFCVEAGRSGPRGGEISTSFQVSTEQLPGKQLHLAARVHRNQTAVWAGVRAMQDKLSNVVGAPVQSRLSPTSLQLTLEHGGMRERVASTLEKLSALPEGEKAVGAVFVVNGVVQGAEVYGSPAMFREMYGKLLRANAIAALADRSPNPGSEATPEAVRRFLEEADRGGNEQLRRGGRGVTRQTETQRAVVFETFDSDGGALVHRSYIAK